MIEAAQNLEELRTLISSLAGWHWWEMVLLIIAPFFMYTNAFICAGIIEDSPSLNEKLYLVEVETKFYKAILKEGLGKTPIVICPNLRPSFISTVIKYSIYIAIFKAMGFDYLWSFLYVFNISFMVALIYIMIHSAKTLYVLYTYSRLAR